MGRRTKTDGKKDLNTNGRKIQLKYKNIEGGWPILSCNSFFFLFFYSYVRFSLLFICADIVFSFGNCPNHPPPPHHLRLKKIQWSIP